MRIGADGIGDRQHHRVGAGIVVRHGRALQKRGGGRSAGKPPVPGGRRACGVVNQRYHAAGANMRNRQLNLGRRSQWLAAAAFRKTIALTGNEGDVVVNDADRERRPVVGAVYAGRHDGGRAGSVVIGIKIVTQLVRLEVAQECRIAGKALQNIVSAAAAQGAYPCQPDGVSVEIPIAPKRGDVIIYTKSAAVAPGAERHQQLVGHGGGSPGVAGSARRNHVGYNQEADFVGEVVVVVGLHGIEHANGKVLHSADGTEELKHEKVGSDGNFHLIAFAGHFCMLYILGVLFAMLLSVRPAAVSIRHGFYIGSFVNDKMMLRRRGYKMAQRLHKPDLPILFPISKNKIIVQCQPHIAATGHLASVSDIGACRQFPNPAGAQFRAAIPACPNIVGKQLESHFSGWPLPAHIRALRVLPGQAAHFQRIDLKYFPVFQLGCQRFSRIIAGGLPLENVFLSAQRQRQ